MGATSHPLSTVSSAIHRAPFKTDCLISRIIFEMILAISVYLKYVEIDHEDRVLLGYVIIAWVELNIVLPFIGELKRQPE